VDIGRQRAQRSGVRGQAAGAWEELVRPRYGGGSLADVLPSVLAALGVPAPDPLGLAGGPLAGVRRVALLLVDGLGARQVPVAAPVAPTLAEIAAGRFGPALELTAGFPSTTPTSLVSVGTGAAPGAHGVLGFTVNVPGTDQVLVHTLWADEPAPAAWQPVPTWFAKAAAAGVAVSVCSRPEYEGSGLTVAAYGGVAYHPASDVDSLAAEMVRALAAGPPALVYGYHPDLDRDGHLFGVDSPRWQAAAVDVDRLLTRLVDGLPADAALLVTADHGQLDVPPERRIDIDTDPRLRAGIRVVAGEPRVRYLHTVAGATDDVLATWRAVLGEAAWVVTREEAVAAGWFGPVPEAHLQRVGDVVAACHDRYAVLATRTEPPTVARLIAYHGSYTAAEMLVPLLVVRGSVVRAG
jgi:Type I phosphodiesterase / nucleotide pyrophosphatase